MDFGTIFFDKKSKEQARELTDKLYAVCEGKTLQVVLSALDAVKTAVQLTSKVMTREEVNECYGKTEDNLAGKADQEPAR